MNDNSQSEWQKIHDELRNNPASQQSIRALLHSPHGETVLEKSRAKWRDKGLDRAPFDFIFDEPESLVDEEDDYEARLSKARAEMNHWPEAKMFDTVAYKEDASVDGPADDPQVFLAKVAQQLDELQGVKEHLFDIAAHGFASSTINQAERTDITLTAKQLYGIAHDLFAAMQQFSGKPDPTPPEPEEPEEATDTETLAPEMQ